MVYQIVKDALNSQRGRLLLWIPVCLSVGIALYFQLRFEPQRGWVSVFMLPVILILWKSYAYRSQAVGILWRAVALIAVGFILAMLRSHSIAEPVLGWRYYGSIEGRVVAIDRSASNKLRAILADPKLGKISAPRTPKFVRLSFHNEIGLEHLTPGAIIRTTGSVLPPFGPAEPGGFDFQRHAWFLQLGAVGYTRKPVVLIAPADLNSYALRLFDLRVRISSYIQRKIPDQKGAFAAAIVTGDRAQIDPAILTNLRRSNLAHLLAISGLHMGLLVGFIFALIRYGLALIPFCALYLPLKKIGASAALIAGISYLQISGGAIATERAFIMVSVMLVGVLLNRPALTLRAIAIAATILLVLRPESLTQAGFQMSFAATTALVASFEFLKNQRHWQILQFGSFRLLQPVIALLMSSFIAGAATAPFSAYHFNQFSQYGLLANLLSVPVMGTVVMPSAVAAGILSLVGLEALPFWIMGQGIAWILAVADFVANLPRSSRAIVSGAGMVLPMISLGAVVFILWRGRLKWIGAGCVIAAFGIWTQAKRPDVLITDTGRMIGVMNGAKRSLNRVKGSGFAARVWLENDGDLTTQEQAFTRWSESYDRYQFQQGKTHINYVWPKKTDPQVVRGICNQSQVLISPNWKEDSLANCFHITADFLRVNGAVSIDIDAQGAKIKSARQITGARIWNSWWLRPQPKRQGRRKN